MAERVIGFRFQFEGTGKLVDELSKVELELKKVNKELKDAQKAGNAEAYSAIRKEQLALQNQAKGLRKEIREQQKAFENTKFATGSYRQLNAELVEARKRFKELSQEERQGRIGQQLVQDIQRLDTQLKKLDAQTGNFQRNVGNYANSLSGLFKGVRKSIRTLRFIERLPFIFSDIGQTIEQVQQAIDFLDVAISANLANERELSKVVKDVSNSYLEQVGTLDNLFDVAQDQNRSDKERQAALDAINEQYSELLPNEREQLKLTDDLTAAQNSLNQAIINNIVTEQKRIKQQEAVNRFIESQREFAEAQESTITQFATAYSFGVDITTEEYRKLAEELRIDRLRKDLGDVAKFGDDLGNALNEAFKGLEEGGADIGDIFGTAADVAIKENNERVRASAQETNQILEGSLADLRKQLSDVQKQINEQVGATDTNALRPLVGTKQELEAQIRVAEDAIKQLEGLTEAEQERQEQQAETNAARLLEIRNNLLLSETQLQEAAILKRQALRDAEIEELATSEQEKTELLRASEEKAQAEITAIAEKGEQERTKQRLNQIQDSQQDIEQELALGQLKIEEQLARGLISSTQAAEQQLLIGIDALKSQIQALENDEALNLELGVELSEEDKEQLILQRQQLNTELAKLEKEYTNVVEEQSTQQTEDRKSKLSEFINFTQDSVNQSVDILNQIFEASQARQTAAIEKRFEREVEAANGSSVRIAQAEERKEKELEKLSKRASTRQKAIAIAQATINGALAITNILANLVDPTPIQAFKAAAIGFTVASTAANIATIAAQKFEHGGDLGLASSPDGVISGRSHAQGGIPLVNQNGTVVEVEGGEFLGTDEFGNRVAVNKHSTRVFGGLLKRISNINFSGKRQLLSDVNSYGGYGKKFQFGGDLSSAPIPAPSVSLGGSNAAQVAELQKQNALLLQQQQLQTDLIRATNNRIDNIRVIANSEEIVREGTKASIVKRTQSL